MCFANKDIILISALTRDVNKRKDILRRDGRCFVCTRKGHVARNCRVNYKCVKCEQRYHVSVCDKDNRDNNIIRDLSDENQLTLHVNSQNSSVLLQRAIAQVLKQMSHNLTPNVEFYLIPAVNVPTSRKIYVKN